MAKELLSLILLVLLFVVQVSSLATAFVPRTIILKVHCGENVDLSLTSPSIEILGLAWKKQQLSVQIIRPAWLSSDYIGSVKDAFDVWEKSLSSFGNTYGYSYLSEIGFNVVVGSTPVTGYDITVEFTSAQATAGGEIGETAITYSGNQILGVRITLYVYTTSGKLSLLDVFNIALHEIGHALGLGHATTSNAINGPEIMYPYYSFPGRELRPTTLDVYALAKVYSWIPSGTFSPPPRQTVVLPSSIPYRMLLYYLVKINSPYGEIEGGGWYIEGAKAVISIKTPIVELGKGVRAVFVGWEGAVRTSDPQITIIVTRDVEIMAKWKIQYYVDVESKFGFNGSSSGWYDEGDIIRVWVNRTIIDFGNKTRYVFKGWQGDINSTSLVIELSVDKPMNITAVWKRQCQVSVDGVYVNSSIRKAWIDEGTVVEISLEKGILDLGNRTRLVHAGWTGSVNSTSPILRVNVTRPLDIKAVWGKEYYVEIKPVYAEANMTSDWIVRGEVIRITISTPMVDHGNDTRHVFYGWVVNGRIVKNPTISVEVDKPLTIKALWRTEYRLSLRFRNDVGEEISFNKAILEFEDESVTLTPDNASGKVWMYRGEWKVSRIEYMSFEKVAGLGSVFYGRKTETVVRLCTGDCGKFTVASPGSLTVELAIYNVTLNVKDIVGLPAPGIEVKIDREKYVSDLDGFLAQRYISGGEHYVEVSILGIVIEEKSFTVDSSGVVDIESPIPVYPIIMLLGITAVAVITRRLLGKKK